MSATMTGVKNGVVIDISGLSFRVGDVDGVVSTSGEFYYQTNQEIAFGIGALQLGSMIGQDVVTFLDLAAAHSKTPPSIDDPGLINRVRLLLSLTDGQGFEKKIVITEKIREVVSRFSANIDLNAHDLSSLDGVLNDIGSELKIALKTCSHARNHIRRAIAGFKVLRDIQIPLRDKQFVLADVYLPLTGQGKHPVLVSNTIYGKRITYSGPDVNDSHDVGEFERAEDEWFTTPVNTDIKVPNTIPLIGRWSLQRRFETVGTMNTFLYVPKGYVMVKVDPRGVSQTPGTRFVPGQESNDMFDAVEWSASQPWSTGSVALAGNSYGANCQWPVARMKPKGLKCFIPFACDVDQYREVAFIGGISHTGYLSQWLAGTRELSPKWKDKGCLYEDMDSNPFYTSYWSDSSAKLEEIDLPVFTASSQVALVHSRGSFEVWRRIASKHKYLEVVDGNYYSWPNHESASKVLAFIDRYLKGIDNDLERVGIQMRLGNKEWYWRTETDWPVPGTEYVKWHLTPDQTLTSDTSSASEAVFSYSAEAFPRGVLKHAGVSFTSAPLTEDLELAGHFAAKVHISSSCSDADVAVLVWALDEHGEVVSFCMRDQVEPLNAGVLRASHRKLDPRQTLPERPFHTHAKEDYAPLQGDEVVELDIELFPATARLRAGWKIRIDICPSEAQPDVPTYVERQFKIWPKEIHDGARNTLHIGGGRENYVLLPKVPLRDLALEKPLESIEY